MPSDKINLLASEVLASVRSDARYLADDTGACFMDLLAEALDKLGDEHHAEIVARVETCINLRLARAGGLI